MADYDGDIKLSVGLDPADVKKVAKQLHDEIKRLFSSDTGSGLSQSFSNLEKLLNALDSAMQKLQGTLTTLEGTMGSLAEKSEILQKTLNGLQNVGGMDGVNQSVSATAENFRDLNLALSAIQYNQEQSMILFRQMVEQLNALATQAGIATTSANALSDAEKQAGEQGEQAVKKVKKAASSFSTLQKIGSRVVEVIKKIVKAMAKISVTAIKKLGKALGSVVSKISGIGKHLSAHNVDWGKLIRQVIKYGLGLRYGYMLWQKLRSYAISALKEMAKQFEEVDDAMSRIVNSFDQFKNSIGTAVQPLLNVFAPVLEKVLGLLTNASEKVAIFMATLTGQDYILKATKSNKKYSDSLKKTEKAAKEANEKLAEYDNLLVIQQDSQRGSGSGDDDSSGALFEKTPIQPSGLAQRIKEAFKSGDFASLGKDLATKINESIMGIDSRGMGSTIAEKVNKALSFASNFITTLNFRGIGQTIGNGIGGFIENLNYGDLFVTLAGSLQGKFELFTGMLESIDWKKVGTAIQTGLKRVNWKGLANSVLTTIRTAFSSVVNFFSGLFEGVDFNKLGSDISGILNDIVTLFDETVNTLDFAGIGTAIGTFINGALENFDLGEFLRVAGVFIGNLFEAGTAIISEINWTAIGAMIFDGICAIDWATLFDQVFEFIGAAIGGLASLIAGFVMRGLDGAVSFFQKKTEEVGGNIVLGILWGITDALLGIVTWIANHIFKPIIDGIKKVFGIASPSKEMKTIGGYIVDGFLAAFDNIAELFGKIWEGLVTVIKAPINLIIGFINTLIGAMEGALNFLINGINTFSIDVPWWVPVIGGSTFGFNIPNVSFPRIPELAQGAVIPPNKEFYAKLGDQKQGLNIEAPLDTIVEAFNSALDNRGDSRQNAPIVLQLNGRTVAQAVWDEEEKRYRQTGSYRPNFA